MIYVYSDPDAAALVAPPFKGKGSLTSKLSLEGFARHNTQSDTDLAAVVRDGKELHLISVKDKVFGS